LVSIFFTIVEVAGVATAFAAVNDTRTSQGAVAWAVSLVALPIVALPLYWVFGRGKFHGYVEALRAGQQEYEDMTGEAASLPRPDAASPRRDPHAPRHVFEALAGMRFMDGNDLELLVDGRQTFDAICEHVAQAKSYVLVQFFIVHDDRLGRRLQSALMAKARNGVRVHFLYDEIGCHSTHEGYWSAMREAGVKVAPFQTTRGRGNRFQINFRNHRKIVVVDGRTAFVGGHNVGDEYMGWDPEIGHWRDTHLRCAGPAVQGVQITFAKDWYWATQELLHLDWSPPASENGADVLALGTGPADKLESCSLMFVKAISSAKSRIWIASPYFVPDEAVTKALQTAALRGVDVRIMIPEKPDHKIVYLAGFYSLKALDMPGVRVYRYSSGFLHQKVFLVDDFLSGVGTANLDNRSFRLNFEITMLIEDKPFCRRVEGMLQEDFKLCRETGPDELDHKPFLFQRLVMFARLLAPIL
ncbi:MAG: cardiolipin synthase, partial [Desulfovibrionaceae bacterium]